jgi:hypothetical protein
VIEFDRVYRVLKELVIPALGAGIHAFFEPQGVDPAT